jgi:hypothetical protein
LLENGTPVCVRSDEACKAFGSGSSKPLIGAG